MDKGPQHPTRPAEPTATSARPVIDLVAEKAEILRRYRGLLRSIKGLDKATVYFDFGRMGCPFDLRVSFWQPLSGNRVGEVGVVHPERRHFIEWLQRQQLDLDSRSRNQVLGQSLTVSVPCGVLDLGNSGGGGASQ